ncbi:MAG: response regulator, partial [Desulfobacterales bacterium]|nr:response regulator [Desulfobacterales bacterium]
ELGNLVTMVNDLLLRFDKSIIEIKILEKIQIAKEAAELASKSKSEFLASMSHELRAPMNSIIGFVDLVLKMDLSSKSNSYLQKVKTSAHHLLNMINEILDYSKIESKQIHLETIAFNLENVLTQVSDMFALKAEEKRIELLFFIDKNVPIHLIGDQFRLSQILINLVGNAVKFTHHGEIIIKIECVVDEIMAKHKTYEKAIYLRFSIQDTGIGMTSTQMELLFDPYIQADASITRKYGGTGLGLYISKNLVEMMNGKIGVTSDLGKGSTFFFTAMFGQQISIETMNLNPLDVNGVRVLVVDDNASSRQIISDILETFECNVTQSASGFEALSELESIKNNNRKFDLVLMDWKMPGMDGIELAENIMNTKKVYPIPKMIMLTAYGNEDMITKALKIGIKAVLIKPVSRSVLLENLIKILNYSSEENSLSLTEKQMNKQVLKGLTVLLVEDNTINQIFEREILEQEGLVVTIVDTGEKAVELLINSDSPSEFDVVLMDLELPEISGYEATKRIREDSRFKDLPIVALSAHSIADIIETCKSVGFSDHLAKPIDSEQLAQVIFNCIQAKKF